MQNVSTRRRKRRKQSPLLPIVIAIALIFGLLRLTDIRKTGCSGDIPEVVRQLGESNPDAAEFVRDYPEYIGQHQTIDLSKEAKSGEVPLLLQWDKRWGYEKYGSSVIGITGCGPTCLSMVAIGLTGDSSADPLTVARYSEKHGYYAKGSGTSWTLMSEGSSHFGLTAQELPLDKHRMESALDEGKPIILSMGPGDFTTSGHYIVLTGYDSDGFTIHDPNSPTRSGEKWSYDAISGQIRNIWAMSAE